jgi:hypothetical protein
MNDAQREKVKSITREELFALVWEAPSTQVARDLGVSDVALGKLCHRLQVPKPPRGYWARVKAGKIPRQPPLAAFREDHAQPQGKRQILSQSGKPLVARLSPMQRDFLKLALDELDESGLDVGECEIAFDGIKAIPPELAAKVLIWVQNRYEKWVEQGTMPARSPTGAHKSISGLVTKLLPIARAQVVLFQRKERQGCAGDRGSAIVVRLSTDIQHRIADLRRLVRDNRLNYIASEIDGRDYALSVRHVYSPNSYASITSELCVSFHEVWFRCEMTSIWNDHVERFETSRISLQQLIPVDLLPSRDIQLPSVIQKSRLRPYAERLKVLQEGEEMCEALLTSVYKIEDAVPDDRMVLAERLWFGREENGPFSMARQAWRNIEQDMEKWELSLELERAELCKEVLGVERGDIVTVESKGQALRIQIEDASVHTYDSKVLFHLSGKRFRKDGMLGKRQEYIYLQVDDDS